MKQVQNQAAYENAIERNIRANARKTFFKTYENASEIIDWVHSKSHKNSFAGSLLDAYHTYGKLTPGQVKAVEKCISRDNARKQEFEQKRQAEGELSEHMGEVGKRDVFVLTIEHILELGMTNVAYGKNVVRDMYICKCGDNQVIYTGSSPIGKKGDVVTVKATVKDHGNYRGVKQTVINRPKLLNL